MLVAGATEMNVTHGDLGLVNEALHGLHILNPAETGKYTSRCETGLMFIQSW
jgi:hypothetical protein